MPGQKIKNSPAFVRRSSSQSMIQFKSLFEILLLMKKIDSIPDQFHKVQSAEVYNIGLVKTTRKMYISSFSNSRKSQNSNYKFEVKLLLGCVYSLHV